MATISSNAMKNQIRMFLVVVVIIVSSVLLVIYVINPLGRISQLQYVFAQKNSALSTYNGTSINNATYPLIHNYASSPPAPVNSWIIESKNGLVVVDTQRQFSEVKNL